MTQQKLFKIQSVDFELISSTFINVCVSLIKYCNLKLIILFALALASCTNNKSIESNDCKVKYFEASRLRNQFDNSDSLRKALNIADQYGKHCPDYNKRFIDLKITLLILLKEYDRGVLLIDSLNPDSFQNSYTHLMYLNSFKARSSFARKDSIAGIKYLKEIESKIQIDIKKNGFKTETFFDLFATQAYYKSKEFIHKEIDDYAVIYPSEKEQLELIKNSINDIIEQQNLE
ncbi:MAG: hypothetical protein H7321_02550 [Bacteroidia bacterium]|nr:hypothetical protein [Bacteroidia bacterium]